MPIQFNNATVELDNVQTIIISDIQPDQSGTDYFVRILNFFDQPVTALNRTPLLTLTLYGGSQSMNDQSGLQVQTPSLEF